MKREFELEQALDDSIARMQTGERLESCLARYPQFAEVLRPLLETALLATQVQTPPSPASAVQQSRERMFAAVDRKFATQSAATPVSEPLLARYTGRLITWITGKENPDMKLITRFAFAAVVVATLIFVGSGVSMASASALPGDALYPAKLTLENIRLMLTFNPDARQELEQKFQYTRRAEIQALVQLGREAQVHFSGELLDFNETSWNVSGIIVQIDAATIIVGDPVVGVPIHVVATVQSDGTLLANKLVVLPILPQGNTNPYPGPSSTPIATEAHWATPTIRPTDDNHWMTETPHATDDNHWMTKTPDSTDDNHERMTKTVHPTDDGNHDMTKTPKPTHPPTHVPSPTDDNCPPTQFPEPTEDHDHHSTETPNPTGGHGGGGHPETPHP